MQNQNEMLSTIDVIFKDSDIRDRPYYAEFRRSWCKAFDKAFSENVNYFNIDSPQCYTILCSYMNHSFDFHIDQLKIAEWYAKESSSRKKVVFFGKKLKRSKKTGELLFHEAVCHYDPSAEETLLNDENRNIIACALPGFPLSMQIVYGNKWVNTRFNPFRRNTIDIFFIGTDYVPAFLGSPLEICLYLFLMDCCIIKSNIGKAKDEDVKKLLHIMRPSPMLRIKGIA